MVNAKYSNDNGIYDIIEEGYLMKPEGGVRVRVGFLNGLTGELVLKGCEELHRWRWEGK